MKYNFDEIVNRRGTDCIKYDALPRYFGDGNLLPLWVADMDFRTPSFIMEAIRRRMEHELLGYTFRGEGFYEAIVEWVRRHHHWNIRKEWIVYTPGVVSALTLAVLAFTQPGEKVVVQPPVYFPFFESVSGAHRIVTENPLRLEKGRYTFDLENLEQVADEQTRMLLLCSPHNPGGMVWKKEELEALRSFCIRKNILVVSDEIHADLLFPGNSHIPWGKLSGDTTHSGIVCMAPSKTFNIAGLSTSYAIIPDLERKTKFEKLLQTLHIHTGNIPGTVALEAAYLYGDEWLSQMMEYIEGNHRYLQNFIARNLPRVKVMKPEATFLVWLDFRDYGMNDEQLSSFLTGKSGVALNNGARFGTGGEGFQRINIGCPRAVLREALDRIASSFTQLDF